MAKTIRIHPTISMVAHQHLEAAIEAGETLSGVINRLLIHQLPKPNRAGGASNKPKDLERQEKHILQQMKPYNEKVEEGSITFVERDERYALIEQLAQVRTELGTAKQTPDEIMQGHYTRELNMLTQQHEAEAEDLFNPDTTPEFHKNYKERAERINTLKDRLK